MLMKIAEGWTGTLGPFTLRLNGTPLALTGLTVTLKLHNALGEQVTPGGTVTPNADQTANPGKVTYTPVAADFVFATGPFGPLQVYQMRWKVVDGASKVVYFPNGPADEIGVYRA